MSVWKDTDGRWYTFLKLVLYGKVKFEDIDKADTLSFGRTGFTFSEASKNHEKNRTVCRRKCEIWKATDGQWYMLLGKWQNAIDKSDCDSFGPFSSSKETQEYLRYYYSECRNADPGGFFEDDSGTRPPPKKAYIDQELLDRDAQKSLSTKQTRPGHDWKYIGRGQAWDDPTDKGGLRRWMCSKCGARADGKRPNRAHVPLGTPIRTCEELIVTTMMES
jgi:hypothetical protein